MVKLLQTDIKNDLLWMQPDNALKLRTMRDATPNFSASSQGMLHTLHNASHRYKPKLFQQQRLGFLLTHSSIFLRAKKDTEHLLHIKADDWKYRTEFLKI